jgi:serine/threonine-protein kinase
MTAGRLQNPNIVIIFDVGETEQGPFIAMEYLDGVTLRDVITAQKKISLHQLVEIITQVAEGLDYAHGKAIIHRDIKPANLMIVAGNRVKIMDLGIARLPMSELTREGKLVGSPSYMSPEQLSGQTIDGRSDLFSLGVCVYQLMTFKKPFPGENINEICYKIVHDEFLPPSRHNPELPPALDEFMKVALAKAPDQRFQSGRELADALNEVAEGEFSGEAPVPALENGREMSTGIMKEELRRDENSEGSYSSNPNLTHSQTINDIFKELTHSSRVMDLSRQRAGTAGAFWWWVAAAGLAAVVALLIILLVK